MCALRAQRLAELCERIILRDYIMELYYGIIFWDDIMESHYGMVLQDNSGIVSQDYIR